MTQIQFTDGERNGVAKAYDETGKLLETTIYKNGEKVNENE